MTTILLFGASGQTGLLFLQHALAKGYKVKAFVRKISSLQNVSHQNLEVIQGDVYEEEVIRHAMRNTDVVVATLGIRKGENPHLQDGIKNIIETMKESGVQRILFLSTFGIGQSPKSIPFLQQMQYLLFQKNDYKDKENQVNLIKRSNLNWVIIQPPSVTDLAPIGNYTIEEIGDQQTNTITRADLIDCMITLITNQTYKQKVITIFNKLESNSFFHT